MYRSELPSMRICISIPLSKFRATVRQGNHLTFGRTLRTSAAHSQVGTGRCCSSEPLVPLSFPVVCRHILLAFCGCLTDSFFVARLEHLATARVAFIKQLRKEVAIPVLVEDQFALGRRGVGLCAPHFEESGSRAVRAGDFHDRQIGVVQHSGWCTYQVEVWCFPHGTEMGC